MSISDLIGNLLVVWIFRSSGDGKEGKDDEGEEWMLYSDHEQTFEEHFNVSIFKRHTFVFVPLSSDTWPCKISKRWWEPLYHKN